MTKIWIIASCYDYEDAHGVFATREAALEEIRKDFEIDDKIPEYFDVDPDDEDTEPPVVLNDSSDFWLLCDEAYSEGRWKSYQFLELDVTTLKLKNARPDAEET